jgi:hypothetical protein
VSQAVSREDLLLVIAVDARPGRGIEAIRDEPRATVHPDVPDELRRLWLHDGEHTDNFDFDVPAERSPSR